MKQPIRVHAAAGFDHQGRWQKRLPDPLPYLFGRAVVILEINIGVQTDDPAYVLLAEAAATIEKGADAEMKPHPRLVVPLQEGLHAIGLPRRQAMNGAAWPQRGKEDCALRCRLEQRRQRVDRGVHLQHCAHLEEKGAGHGSRRFARPAWARARPCGASSVSRYGDP